jgi:hypothetical protein
VIEVAENDEPMELGDVDGDGDEFDGEEIERR